MREYEEGILLFEATKINVWDKANQDTVGLQQFYSLHHNLYFWPEKAKTLLISIKGADQKTAEKIYKYTESNSVEKVKSKFNKKGIEISDSMAEYEKGAKETGDIQWQKSKMTYLQKDNSGNSYSFRKILEILPSKEKTLTEARGYVVADYQDYLEKAWIKQLEKEFEVVIFKDVLDKLKK
jgi:peptidyl-prolyl cis-trans isomerase SurA